MQPPSLPRFEATQRRDFLKRAAAVAGLALIPGLAAACSKGDDETTFAGASTTAASGAATSTTTAASTADGATTTTAAASSSGDPLPDGAALDLAFTFTATGGTGGPSRNPYIAAWIETADGDLVANLGVWYDAPKGNRWVNNLSTWYTAVSSTDSTYLETTTGATQPAGTYTLNWDGTDTDGARAAQGDYVVFLESAQEHGNHSLTSAEITLGGSDATASLPDDGDLSAATATYSA